MIGHKNLLTFTSHAEINFHRQSFPIVHGTLLANATADRISLRKNSSSGVCGNLCALCEQKQVVNLV